MNKLNILESTWQEAEIAAKQKQPIKTLRSIPKMPGMTQETAEHLTWKSIFYLLRHDPKHIFPRHFFKKPFSYAYNFLKSAFKKSSYKRDGDFFLYGISNVEEFKTHLSEGKDPLAIGFSYCHKPFECPSGRFTDKCAFSIDNPVCAQCFIGKVQHHLPKTSRPIYPLFIPTIHYIGEEMFKLREKHPKETLLFIITACEMTLEMFGNWGNMIQAKGIGVRLDGRICNTMRAFELSEKGVKPGLTVVLPHTQQRILELVHSLWKPSADDEMA